ncbi:MAG: hypothetical protein K6T88_17705 [Bacillus sp. (in: Bacteria)]|nr:hypothetical protein [Bacillus sp. (in: firmicutes)]
MVIFLGSLMPMYQNNKAYAYLSIDVNPSIELGFNKKMQVIELTGYNKEGKGIISQLDNWKKEDVLDLTQTILAKLKKEGFLKAKEHVIISTVRTKVLGKKVEKKLQDNIVAIKETVNHEQIKLTVLTGTKKEMEKAHTLGITTGKYQENKIQLTNIQEIKDQEKTKENGKKKDKIAVPVQPVDQVSPEKVKKQTENNNDQNNGVIENNKQNEKIHANELSIPPGQLKNWEEEKIKQNKGLQKEKVFENRILKPKAISGEKNNQVKSGR